MWEDVMKCSYSDPFSGSGYIKSKGLVVGCHDVRISVSLFDWSGNRQKTSRIYQHLPLCIGIDHFLFRRLFTLWFQKSISFGKKSFNSYKFQLVLINFTPFESTRHSFRRESFPERKRWAPLQIWWYPHVWLFCWAVILGTCTFWQPTKLDFILPHDKSNRTEEAWEKRIFSDEKTI